jgi:hypothetical protein
MFDTFETLTPSTCPIHHCECEDGFCGECQEEADVYDEEWDYESEAYADAQARLEAGEYPEPILDDVPDNYPEAIDY